MDGPPVVVKGHALQQHGIFHPSRIGYRLLVLLFNCLLTFGSYFCFDMPSVLETRFENGPHDKPAGLGLSSTQYNLLYAIYAWTNALMVIVAGYLIDKLGTRFGVMLFSGLCLIGSVLFAVGVTVNNFPVMLLGRLIFGSGNGSLTVVQNKITAFWFDGKELAMAFGFTLAFSRLGSVLNFLLTAEFANDHGLKTTLWGGAVLCSTGFIAAIIVSFMDKWGSDKLGVSGSVKQASKRMRFRDILKFGAAFWMLSLAIMFFYNGVFPFVADASDFIQVKYNVTDTEGSHVAGSVYYVSMVASPFMGGIIDVLGGRGYLAVACAALTIPVFVILAFVGREVSPYIPVLWLGCTYSVAAATLWPSIPLLVDQSTVGTAMGVATSIQMIGIGICNLVVGALRGDATKLHTPEQREANLDHWQYVMEFLLANAIAGTMVAVILNMVDKKHILNKTKRSKAKPAITGDEGPDDETSALLKDKASINAIDE